MQGFCASDHEEPQRPRAEDALYACAREGFSLCGRSALVLGPRAVQKVAGYPTRV